jgi:hypothetical protein
MVTNDTKDGPIKAQPPWVTQKLAILSFYQDRGVPPGLLVAIQVASTTAVGLQAVCTLYGITLELMRMNTISVVQ